MVSTSSTSHPTITQAQPERAVTRHLWRAALLAAILATVAGLVIRGIGITAGAVPADFALLQPARIIVVSLLAAMVAAALLAALARWARHPIRTFRIVAGVFLVISLLGPLGASADTSSGGPASGAAIAIMLMMHIVAAVVIVVVLTTLTRLTPGRAPR